MFGSHRALTLTMMTTVFFTSVSMEDLRDRTLMSHTALKRTGENPEVFLLSLRTEHPTAKVLSFSRAVVPAHPSPSVVLPVTSDEGTKAAPAREQ